MKKYYVYKHIRNGDDPNNPFYVGKGCGDRCRQKGKRRSAHWNRIVEKYGYYILIIKDNLTESEAFDLEIKMILKFKSKGKCEANMSDGGDGVKVLKRWWGDKISQSLKGIHRDKGIDNKGYKDVATKEQLYDLYVVQKKGIIEIGKILDVSYGTISTRLIGYDIPRRISGREKLAIVCIEDGKEFDSISEAARFYGAYRENIKKVLKGIYKQTKGLTFKYKE